MVTIEINGVKVEGETLKIAQRLAKKEERRQAEVEELRVMNRSRAHDMAYASVGRILYLVEKNPRALALDEPRRHITTTEEECYSFLQVEGRGQGPVGLLKVYKTDSVRKVLIDSMDRVVAILFSWGCDQPMWYAVGTHEGETVTVEIPSCLVGKLNDLYRTNGWKVAA